MEKIIYVSLPYATFGLVSNDEVITFAPPIAKWSINKCEKSVIEYYKKKGACIDINIIKKSS